MALHFDRSEYQARLDRLLASMQQERLDGMLLFSQESLYWLTGYDTFGFCFWQVLVLRGDGRMALLTRSADLRQAQLTSVIPDIRIWKDGRDAQPAGDTASLVAELGLGGKRLGVETEAHGLTYANGRRLEVALAGQAELVEASGIVPRLRCVKSAAEIAFVRRAAALSDAADEAGLDAIAAGADEGDILAAQQSAVFRGGGDYPANEFIIGSAREALLCRSKSGRRTLSARDQITLEFAGVYRRYHAAAMRTVVVGEPEPLHVRYHAAAREALLACEAALRPGATAGDVFAAHCGVLDAHGLSSHRLNACGYSLGTRFAPSWMDPPMFYEANEWVMEPGMVMFLHMILMDSDSAVAMCLGRTSLVTPQGRDTLNVACLDLLVR